MSYISSMTLPVVIFQTMHLPAYNTCTLPLKCFSMIWKHQLKVHSTLFWLTLLSNFTVISWTFPAGCEIYCPSLGGPSICTGKSVPMARVNFLNDLSHSLRSVSGWKHVILCWQLNMKVLYKRRMMDSTLNRCQVVSKVNLLLYKY